MQKRIFYSWQSDLPNNSNRGFISDALSKAISQLVNDDEFSMTPSIDRDTQNELGSPDIVQTIFNKIASCDVFVCDISFINSNTENGGRLMPNPNVILELGYAVGKLGWEKIILVMNIHFGAVGLLPFDLRGRRVLTYNLDPEAETKAEERRKVTSTLSDGIKKILNHFNKNLTTTNEIIKTDVETLKEEPGKQQEKNSPQLALQIILEMPYTSGRDSALQIACDKLIAKDDLQNAVIFAIEMPYTSSKAAMLSKIAEKAIASNNVLLAKEVISKIPYTSTKDLLSNKLANRIEL